MQQIAVSNGTLGLLDQGTGLPILFVHGFPLSHAMWQSQVAAFSQEYRVLAPDLRGFGESSVTPGTVSMETFADDLHSLLSAVKVSQPIVFCGLSMGGYVAWQFLRKYRSQLRGLILCDTRAAADTPAAAAGRQKLADEILSGGSQVAHDAMLPRLFAATTAERIPERVSEVRSIMLRNDPAGLAAALRGMGARPDSTALLASIDLPTLVICGHDDQISPVAEMRGMAQAIPGARFVEVPDAGHMSPVENPATVNAAIKSYLSEIEQ